MLGLDRLMRLFGRSNGTNRVNLDRVTMSRDVPNQSKPLLGTHTNQHFGSTDLLGDQLDQVCGSRHEREAVQQNPARCEDVGVTLGDDPGAAREIGRGQPGRIRPRATGSRRLTIVADFFQRQRARPMKPQCSEVGAGRKRRLPQLGRVADLHAAKSLGVEGALARALDGGFERRVDVQVSV